MACICETGSGALDEASSPNEPDFERGREPEDSPLDFFGRGDKGSFFLLFLAPFTSPNPASPGPAAVLARGRLSPTLLLDLLEERASKLVFPFVSALWDPFAFGSVVSIDTDLNKL